MNEGLLKVCPLCGHRSFLEHSILDKVGKEYMVVSSIVCNPILTKGCGLKLFKTTFVPEEQVSTNAAKGHNDALASLDAVRLTDEALFARWNNRKGEFVYKTNSMLK